MPIKSGSGLAILIVSLGTSLILSTDGLRGKLSSCSQKLMESVKTFFGDNMPLDINQTDSRLQLYINLTAEYFLKLLTLLTWL